MKKPLNFNFSHHPAFGATLVVLSGVLYGCLGIFGTFLIQDGFSVSSMLFWRFFAAALTLPLLGVSAFGGEAGRFSRSDLKDAGINALLYSLSSGLYFVASKRIGTGLGMVIFYSYPVFIYLWLWLFAKEAISRLSWASLFMVCTGLLFLSGDSSGVEGYENWLGIGLAVASCLGYAGYILLSKHQARKLNPLVSTFILCLLSSAYFFLLMLKEGGRLWPSSLEHFLIILALGFLATGLPIFLMLKGLQSIHADQAAVLSVFEPLVTVVLGAWVLKERIGAIQYLGIGIVLTGAVTSSLGKIWAGKQRLPGSSSTS